MSYLIHETGIKINLMDDEGKLRDRTDVVNEISTHGLTIGNVTLARMMEGKLPKTQGWEYIETISPEEQKEIADAVASVEQKTAEASEESVAETAQPTVAGGEDGEQPQPTEDTVAEEPAKVPEEPVASEEPADTAADADAPVVDPAEVRRRMLGTAMGDAITTAETSTDAKAVEEAKNVIKQSGATSADMVEARTRRHNKREETIAAARVDANWATVITAIEGGLVPAVALNYANPDMRWLEFTITEKIADANKPHVRTNPYVDLAILASGGYGFSLYKDGKSVTKRQKTKETDLAKLVEIINAWLPTAMKENGL